MQENLIFLYDKKVLEYCFNTLVYVSLFLSQQINLCFELVLKFSCLISIGLLFLILRLFVVALPDFDSNSCDLY